MGWSVFNQESHGCYEMFGIGRVKQIQKNNLSLYIRYCMAMAIVLIGKKTQITMFPSIIRQVLLQGWPQHILIRTNTKHN